MTQLQTPTLMGGTPSGADAGTTSSLPLNAAGTAMAVEGTLSTASTSTHIGAAISLSDTASHQGASRACDLGAFVSAPAANTATIYVGLGQNVTTSIGTPLEPGQSMFLPVANTNQIWAITSTATQGCRVLGV